MQFLVREMQPNEEVEVKSLFERSLGITDRIIFGRSFEEAQKSARKENGGTLVAKYNGRIVGTVSMRIETLKGRRVGYVDALVTDKGIRGRGVGGSLVDGAILWLEEHGCEIFYATADRYNSPSWNMFIHRGFHPYELPQQLSDYGVNVLRLWLGEFYFISFGTFFLRRDKELRKPREIGETWHWLAALLGVSVVWWIQILRSQGPLMFLPALFGVTSLSLLSHELSQRLVARKMGLQTTFKAWGSGILFSWLLALGGIFLPAYGSTYVKRLDWWYEPKNDKTGIIFTSGALVSLALAFAFWTLTNLTTNSPFADPAKVGYAISVMIVIFNMIPIQAAGGFVWDGKKIYVWNKYVWTALIIATSVLIILDNSF